MLELANPKEEMATTALMLIVSTQIFLPAVVVLKEQFRKCVLVVLATIALRMVVAALGNSNRASQIEASRKIFCFSYIGVCVFEYGE